MSPCMFLLAAGKPYFFLAVLGGVGWGNIVHVHLHTMVMLRYEIVSSIWGGVGSALTLDATV